MSVVCLFVAKDSIYKSFPNCDCYDVDRDATTYDGWLPVVAHPPCQLWGSLAHVNYARWGGEHNRPKNDGGLFKFALDTVRRCGGVLEHPANTVAWAEYGLIKPDGTGWQLCLDGGWVCEVWQSAYGHKANKATWLYCVGNPVEVRQDTPRGTHQIGFADQRGKDKNKPTVSKREAIATPVEFAEFLVAIAEGCNQQPQEER